MIDANIISETKQLVMDEIFCHTAFQRNFKSY